MKFNYLIALVTIGSMALYSCKKDDNGGGGTTTPTVTSLACGTASFSTSALTGTYYIGTATVSYGGGNGAAYTSGTAVSSTGVTGLTATLVAGTLTNGSGTVTFNVLGTPASAGTASFAITVGGQSCSINLAVTAPVVPDYCGKWMYNTILDSVYNYQELVNNNNFLLDSVRNYDYSTSGYYFQFNQDLTFQHLRSNTGVENGTYTTEVSFDSYWGTDIRALHLVYSTSTVDTFDYYIMAGATSTNMTLERFYAVLTSPTDTVVRDRFYSLIR